VIEWMGVCFSRKGMNFRGLGDRRNVSPAPVIGPGRFAPKNSPISRDSKVVLSNFSLMVLESRRYAKAALSHI
jgi:hypothetical protein